MEQSTLDARIDEITTEFRRACAELALDTTLSWPTQAAGILRSCSETIFVLREANSACLRSIRSLESQLKVALRDRAIGDAQLIAITLEHLVDIKARLDVEIELALAMKKLAQPEPTHSRLRTRSVELVHDAKRHVLDVLERWGTLTEEDVRTALGLVSGIGSPRVGAEVAPRAVG